MMRQAWLTAASLPFVVAGGPLGGESDIAGVRRMVVNSFLPTELSQALPAVKHLIKTKVPSGEFDLTLVVAYTFPELEVKKIKDDFRSACREGQFEEEECLNRNFRVITLSEELDRTNLRPHWVKMLQHGNWDSKIAEKSTLHQHSFWRAFHPSAKEGTDAVLAEWFASPEILPHFERADYLLIDVFSPLWNYAKDFLPDIPRSVWVPNREFSERLQKLEARRGLRTPEDEPHGATAFMATISPFYEKFAYPFSSLPGGLPLYGDNNEVVGKRELLCVGPQCVERNNSEELEHYGSRLALVTPMSPVAEAAPPGSQQPQLTGVMAELQRRVALDDELQIVYMSLGTFGVVMSAAGLETLVSKHLKELLAPEKKFLVVLRLRICESAQKEETIVSDDTIRKIVEPHNGLLWGADADAVSPIAKDSAKLLFVRDYLDQRGLMQHFGSRLVFVGHGGVGGVSDALVAAVPVIVLPGTAEQLDNGLAADEVRLGSALPTIAKKMLQAGELIAGGGQYSSTTAVSVTRESEFWKRYSDVNGLLDGGMRAEEVVTLPQAVEFWVEERRNGQFAANRKTLQARMAERALTAVETAGAFWRSLYVGYSARVAEEKAAEERKRNALLQKEVAAAEAGDKEGRRAARLTAKHNRLLKSEQVQSQAEAQLTRRQRKIQARETRQRQEREERQRAAVSFWWRCFVFVAVGASTVVGLVAWVLFQRKIRTKQQDEIISEEVC